MASRPSRLVTMMRGAALPGLALVVMAFFGGYAVLGSNGMLAYGDYRRLLVTREREFQALDSQRAVLRNRVSLLDPRHADPDMADELVRRQLGVVHPDEVIVPLR